MKDDDLPEEPYPADGPEEQKDDVAPGDDILAANEAFYSALASLDLDRMSAVWFQADWVTCVHPGWPMITGWELIRSSWERIFQNTGSFQVSISNLGVRVENATAWITCNEKILTLSSSGVSAGRAVATNIFLRTPDGWKLALHHASPIPDEAV